MDKDNRLTALRRAMKKRRIDLYLVFLADPHASEYVVEAYGQIAWLSGFTGTNATIVVTQDEAGLWTDGRYFIQAKRQLAGSGVTLFAMGEEGVPTVEEYVREHLPKRGCLGYDGKVVPLNDHEGYEQIARKRHARVVTGYDLIDGLWTDRPALPKHPAWVLKKKYAGQTVDKKLNKVLGMVKKAGAQALLLTSLCDIAWLLNLRGDDIRHVPVAMSFFYLSDKKRMLFIAPEALNEQVRAHLQHCGIRVRPYETVYDAVKRLRCRRLMVDPHSVSIALADALPKRVKLVRGANPTEALKAKKNRREIKNTRKAHIRDGVAVTKFIYCVKTKIGTEPLSECSAAHMLHGFRAQQKHFLDESFDTIAAYGANAAMMHYEPDEQADVPLEPRGFFLVDSGGHYLEGTTDITRTIALGELTDEERHGYTLTLKGALRLMAARFPVGTIAQGLDVLARGPFWNEGLDYRCGTGHGVGHILSVHEGPNGFRSKLTERLPACELKAGMITTDEPGLYVEDGFGVRIENELLCVKGEKTEYGQFLRFENITMAPIDLEPVDASLLTAEEKQTLNAYHKRVYKTLRPYLTKEEARWLKQETRPI